MPRGLAAGRGLQEIVGVIGIPNWHHVVSVYAFYNLESFTVKYGKMQVKTAMRSVKQTCGIAGVALGTDHRSALQALAVAYAPLKHMGIKGYHAAAVWQFIPDRGPVAVSLIA